MLRLSAPEFSLAHTLECGQAFRWQFRNGAYYGYLGGAAVRVRQEQQELVVETVDPHLTAEQVRHYFALDHELGAILSAIDVDPLMHDAIERFRGLRVLRQDPWECLASFILSSFNNIKRIQGMIERVAQAYGQPAAFNGFRGCTFPSAERMAGVSERRLHALGLGFRAGYLKATARLVANGKLPFESLRRSEYRAAKRALLACEGVGDKVADCVALFGLEHYEAFPIDVWIQRAMRYYFGPQRLARSRMHAFAAERFGRHAGYAQQYLYHYMRITRGALSVERLAESPIA